MSELSADEWNLKHDEVIDVFLVNDLGEVEITKTRSLAWTLGHGTPVVAVEGRIGGYLLERLTPASICRMGSFCKNHGFIHGAEAEEFRKGIEEFISGGVVGMGDLRRLLDTVDARDSLAFLESGD